MVQVMDTPDAITYARLAAVKGMIKLQAQGMKHSSGVNVKARMAEEFGLSARAKPAVVIAKIQEKMDFILKAKQMEIASVQLKALCDFMGEHGSEKLEKDWETNLQLTPELQVLRGQKGQDWLTKAIKEI